MTQTALPLRNYQEFGEMIGDTAEAIGLTCEADIMTLRFMANNSAWGSPLREITIDKDLAEKLSQMLHDELGHILQA